MRLEITTQAKFDEAFAKGLFALATSVFISNCALVKEIPALDAATVVRIENNPGLTVLPALDAATVVWIENNPGVVVNHSKFECK